MSAFINEAGRLCLATSLIDRFLSPYRLHIPSLGVQGKLVLPWPPSSKNAQFVSIGLLTPRSLLAVSRVPSSRYYRIQSNCKNHDFVELHIGRCGACMESHFRASRNLYESTCDVSHLLYSFSHRYVGLARPPIFFIRITDGASHLSLIPNKYHVFTSPSLRCVYLG